MIGAGVPTIIEDALGFVLRDELILTEGAALEDLDLRCFMLEGLRERAPVITLPSPDRFQNCKKSADCPLEEKVERKGGSWGWSRVF